MRRASTALARALASRHALGAAANAGTQLTAAHALRAAASSATGVLSCSWEWQHGGHVRGFAANVTEEDVDRFVEDLEDDDEVWRVEAPSYPMPMASVGNKAPLFTTKAVVDGEFKTVSLSDYKGKYVVLFFYPKDFTFVCPTEIIAFSDRAKEFEKLGAQLMACSTDTEECHLAWIKTPRNKGGLGYMQIPLLADTTKAISASYGVLLERAGVALRGLFIINPQVCNPLLTTPQGIIQQITINDLPIGRSVDETLRLLQAIQFNAEHGEVCPADWKPGGKSMIADPEKSLEYFNSMNETGGSGTEEFGSSLRSIESKRDFDSLVRSSKPTVVDFYAPWCGKCRMISPFVEELAAKHPELTFAKFDTTAEPLEGLSAELGVKALPVFKFFKDGKEVSEQVIGYKKAPLQAAVTKLAAANK